MDRQERLAITECPISYISGDSLAWLEEFYAQQALGGAAEIQAWPARRVEAFAVLKGELRKAEASEGATGRVGDGARGRKGDRAKG